MGRWAANHDQRKGQWLVNTIRSRNNLTKVDSLDEYYRLIELRLWNMDNNEFDEIMGKYYD